MASPERLDDAARLRETLALIAPGTSFRDGLERILRGRTGALIVVGHDKDVEGITTAATPSLTGTTTAYNSLGDRAAVTLPPSAVTGACDATCVAALQGNRIVVNVATESR